MDLAWNILVGNGISFIAGIFLIVSYCINDVKKAYKYQFLNAFVLAISSVFFLSWTGVTTLSIASARNAMVYKDRLTFNWTIFFLIISVVLGVLVNTMGFIGLLPVVAIVQITVCNYTLKSIKSIKVSFIVNSLIYIVYFLAILDFTSAAVETITVALGTLSLVRLIKK
ncbi:YgjV family protein [uncultured Methanobrevibacter sp.]|uniref:YgjV family protein n=1 Tax=uncultured Methanobrevibacter sp. TaxID=253161 RepID=UPI0025E926C3|nr:YgjV family protein [uncultured Methanobrevibacter sp.]